MVSSHGQTSHYGQDRASNSECDFAILTLVGDAGCHTETLRCRPGVLVLGLAEPTDHHRLGTQHAACYIDLRIERRFPKQDVCLDHAPQGGVVVSSKHRIKFESDVYEKK
jgi:hypothetical protein